MIQIAQNNGRYYRISTMQMRYFPIARREAEALIAAGKAVEAPYLPYSRPELYQAYKVAQAAISRAQAADARPE
jgi:hypothetical protein